MLCCSCVLSCCCCQHRANRRKSQISVGRLNYDGMDDGQPSFQLQNLVASWEEDDSGLLKFEWFDNGGGTSIAFMPPVACRVAEMQRPCQVDENVCFIVPEQEYAKVVEAEARLAVSSEINVFDGNPTAHLVFKSRRGRITLRVILGDVSYALVRSIPVGTQLCWVDGGGKPTVQWWNAASWGSSMSSVMRAQSL